MRMVYRKANELKRHAALITAVLLLAALCGCSAARREMGTDAEREVRTITDMGNRQVIIPQKIDRVFCSNPIGTVNVYMLAPDRLAGWNFKPQGEDRKFIEERYLELPSLGVWMGAGATPNTEEIAKADPDVIFCFWSTNSDGVEMAESIEVQTGIPVILMDYDIDSSDEVYRLLGEYLDVKEKAELLSRYCRSTLDSLSEKLSSVPEEKRIKIFISQGRGGLQTDPVGSIHIQDVMDFLGFINVADLPGSEGRGMGMPSVSLEQIAYWNPDVVLINEYNMNDSLKSDLYGEILSSPQWSEMEAVQSGRVYDIPQSPFSWLGKPPSAARVLGAVWLTDLLYPDYMDMDIRTEIRNFYRVFYRYALTEQEIDRILRKSR